MRVVYVLIILSVLFLSCSSENTGTVSFEKKNIETKYKNYLDFEYSKAIAFATVHPFDFTNWYVSKNIDPKKLNDTISVKLNSLQIEYLNGILSGRLSKAPRLGLEDKAVADCFYPRHNIVFLNKSDSVVNYISICFECGNMKQSKPFLAEIEDFRSFFDSLGLKVFDRPDYYHHYYDSLNRQRIRN